MTDELTTPQTEDPTPDAPTPSPSAGTENTRSEDEGRIPKARFDVVLQERNELKTRLEKLEADAEKRRKAEMTDTERAKAEAEEAAQKATLLEQQLEQERAARRADKRDSAIAHALAAAQAIDADETVLWLTVHRPDDVKAAMREDGTLDPDQIKTLVDLARTERPHHFRPGGVGSPSNAGGALPAANVSADVQAAAALLESQGYQPNKERLASFVNQSRDQTPQKRG